MEIMNTFTSRSAQLCTLCSLVLGAMPGASAAELVLHKVPALTVEQASAYPENLARRHLGARVESTSASGDTSAAAALLSGDPTARYSLPAGSSSLLIALPKIENVDSISFTNSGAKGNVSIATSNAKLPADSPQWQKAADEELSGDTVKANIGPSEAKYVRLTFNVTEPGQIGSLGLYATAAVSDFTKPRSAAAEEDSTTIGLISYNRSDIHSKARALYVSSGSDAKQAHNIIDDQTNTTYSFAAEDGTPATVIDLGKTSSIRRLSAAYAPRAGKMEFYVLKSLPRRGANADTITLDEATFATMAPVGTANDDGSAGRASVDFPETSGRYVMVRWLPAAQENQSFTLAEVAAIGSTPNGQLLAANTSGPTAEGDDQQAEASSYDGKTAMDGKTMIDAKDMPGEGPAEEAPQSPGEGPPPSLPQPPPFTFVPVLVPTSP